MYLNIFFCLDISYLASLMCRDWLGCLRYKYVLTSIVKSLSRGSNKYIYFLKYLYLSALGVGVM